MSSSSFFCFVLVMAAHQRQQEEDRPKSSYFPPPVGSLQQAIVTTSSAATVRSQRRIVVFTIPTHSFPTRRRMRRDGKSEILTRRKAGRHWRSNGPTVVLFRQRTDTAHRRMKYRRRRACVLPHRKKGPLLLQTIACIARVDGDTAKPHRLFRYSDSLSLNRKN